MPSSETERQHRIALMVPSLDNGGGVPSVARFILRVCEGDPRFEVSVISLAVSSKDPVSVQLLRPSTWLRGPLVREFDWNGARVRHVGAWFSEFEFQRYRTRRQLRELLKDSDLVQVVCGSPAWALPALGLDRPVSMQVATRVIIERQRRDAHLHGISGWWRRLMTRVTSRADDRGLRSVAAVQVENEWMHNYAQEINRDRPHVDVRFAPPGVDENRFVPLERRTFGGSGKRYILCTGRLSDPRKNPQLLLDAFSEISDSFPEVDLLTAGFSAPPASYWAAVRERGLEDRVKHVDSPSRGDLVTLYQNAAAFALTSDEEGLGLVLLEAMACAIPVVATRCGGPEAIITDGVDGLLVGVGSVTQTAEALCVLLRNVAGNEEMGRKGRRAIEDRFSYRKTGAAFVSVWERLLEKSERPSG